MSVQLDMGLGYTTLHWELWGQIKLPKLSAGTGASPQALSVPMLGDSAELYFSRVSICFSYINKNKLDVALFF